MECLIVSHQVFCLPWAVIPQPCSQLLLLRLCQGENQAFSICGLPSRGLWQPTGRRVKVLRRFEVVADGYGLLREGFGRCRWEGRLMAVVAVAVAGRLQVQVLDADQ